MHLFEDAILKPSYNECCLQEYIYSASFSIPGKAETKSVSSWNIAGAFLLVNKIGVTALTVKDYLGKGYKQVKFS